MANISLAFGFFLIDRMECAGQRFNFQRVCVRHRMIFLILRRVAKNERGRGSLHISKTVGSAMVALCLVSTLAMAQSQSSAPPIPQAQNPTVYLNKAQHPPQSQAQVQPQPMTCTKDDKKGTCTAAAGADGKEIVGGGRLRHIWDASTFSREALTAWLRGRGFLLKWAYLPRTDRSQGSGVYHAPSNSR